MRVAFDVSSTRGQKTGIGIYTENLMRALREHAPEIEVVKLEDGATADQRTDRRIRREQLVLPRLARESRADVLHLTGFAAPRRAPCPVVLTVQDLIGVLFAKNFPPAARFYWSRYLPFTLRFPRQLITLSEHTKKDIVHLTKIPSERIQVIPPGRDESFHRIENGMGLESVRAKLGLPARFILFVSTLEPRKGVDTLIAAFAHAAPSISADLVIVGKRGWYADRFFSQVNRLGIAARVHFLEYVAAPDLPLLYNLAQAFVFPSRYEGFGLPPLEAMACGVPVICSNASSLPEMIGDAGILIPPDDVAGFARAMIDVLRDNARREVLRERGLRQAQKFSWERAARATAQVYWRVHERESEMKERGRRASHL